MAQELYDAATEMPLPGLAFTNIAPTEPECRPSVHMSSHPQNTATRMKDVIEASNKKELSLFKDTIRKHFFIIWLCLALQSIFIVTALGVTAKAKVIVESHLQVRDGSLKDLNSKLQDTQQNVCALQNTGIRLTSSKTSSGAGWLEMFCYGEWGSVCSSAPYTFNDDAAAKVCRFLGYSSGLFSTDESDCVDRHGPSPLPVKVRGYKCYGTERNIYECYHEEVLDVEVASCSTKVCVECD